QEVLETFVPRGRLVKVTELLQQELGALEIEEDLNSRVHDELERGQREIWLREQLRVIQGELGEGDVFQQEQADLRRQIEDAHLPAEPRERAHKELARLGSMPPATPEAGILRTWIDWIITLPWSDASEDNLDVSHARKVLDAGHYGLPRVKDRILEAIAVRKLAGKRMENPVLCFVGPPGVGKTSLGESIARALGRKFVRVSLGGVRDEAEIRGHRRTYIGALPGRVLQTMKRAGTVNPVFMLDEIDKLGMDFRGDPADSLLEVLDPEQNSKFSDHYLEVPYDLSQVLFITTANELDTLPPALLDRMEVIEFPGYLEEEKIDIARQFLLPGQFARHGLEDRGIRLEKSALQTIIRDYTWEAGVRNLNREIANINRKLARLVAEERPHPARINAGMVSRWLGPPHFLGTRALDGPSLGMATGLVWTWGGGDIAIFEVSLLPGKGSLTMTGNLGDVMQESAQTALSHVRSLADMFVFPAEDLEQTDIHVHVPEGAVPKEGPSAGITLATALVSAMSERPVRPEFGMTGEITLRGKVLPVGGVREKLMAARRAGLSDVVLPTSNRKDLVDVPKRLRRSLHIHLVDSMQQVIDLVLLPPANGRVPSAGVDGAEIPVQDGVERSVAG
ncbi:MAG: endopeptidase La, partial [Anaerolineaceae bacterium]|nr:endopeptidase La [Anaerolineaceae bacterium]